MKKFLTPDELILNSDQSIYHLRLVPEMISNTIITVGDPNRVASVSQHFEKILYSVQNREFRTETGIYKKRKLTVISTGIGTDNVDIVMNELDALVNVDLKSRSVKSEHTSLSFIRIGTSGTLQADLAVDSLLVSKSAIGLDGLLHFYEANKHLNNALSEVFNNTFCPPIPAYACDCHLPWLTNLPDEMAVGITCTNTGFYGPQARNLRIDSRINKEHLVNFRFNGNSIANLEMETAGIYGLSKLLGHKAISFNAILANRSNLTFSQNPNETIDQLITKVLDWIIETSP